MLCCVHISTLRHKLHVMRIKGIQYIETHKKEAMKPHKTNDVKTCKLYTFSKLRSTLDFVANCFGKTSLYRQILALLLPAENTLVQHASDVLRCYKAILLAPRGRLGLLPCAWYLIFPRSDPCSILVWESVSCMHTHWSACHWRKLQRTSRVKGLLGRSPSYEVIADCMTYFLWATGLF